MVRPVDAAQWADEFNGTGAPDSANWTYDTGGGGWGNGELEYYQSGAANATQTGGHLQIQARRQSVGGMAYTSARIKTQGKRNFGPYGYMQAQIQGPMGQGLWPAFWMLGSDITSVPWPGCGEIDIMEHINSAPNVLGTIHWDNGGHVSYQAMNTNTSFGGYHNYAINWTSSSITWYVDGGAAGSANIANNINSTEEFHKSFFVLLNLAVGGTWPGSPNSSTVFPANYNIDWIAWN
jgi:beta-glucanase (GH16 family)